MNKTELIAAVAEKAELSKKDAEAAVTATIDAITEALVREEKVQLVGFGSFEIKSRAERVGRNPKTKATIQSPASTAPVFKAGTALKDAVAQYAPGLSKRRFGMFRGGALRTGTPLRVPSSVQSRDGPAPFPWACTVRQTAQAPWRGLSGGLNLCLFMRGRCGAAPPRFFIPPPTERSVLSCDWISG